MLCVYILVLNRILLQLAVFSLFFPFYHSLSIRSLAHTHKRRYTLNRLPVYRRKKECTRLLLPVSISAFFLSFCRHFHRILDFIQFPLWSSFAWNFRIVTRNIRAFSCFGSMCIMSFPLDLTFWLFFLLHFEPFDSYAFGLIRFVSFSIIRRFQVILHLLNEDGKKMKTKILNKFWTHWQPGKK